MTEDRDKLLLNLEVRVRQVMLLCDRLKQENNRLKDEHALKDENIESLEKDLKVLKQKYKHICWDL